MTHGLETYIFIDENDSILEEWEFGDDETAEKNCERLMKKFNKVIGCYKEIVIMDPINFKKEIRHGIDHGPE